MKHIAHITDIHLSEQFPADLGVKAKENWKVILADIAKRDIHHILFTGDIGAPDAYEWFFNAVKSNGFTMDIVLGNHDSFAYALKYFNPSLAKDASELYYSYEKGDFKYIFIDTSAARISGEQFAWFKMQLQTSKKIILLTHYPVLETGTTPQKEYPLHGSHELVNELKKIENEVLVLCGHLHFDDEQQEGNVKQIITPAACYQLKKHSTTTAPDHIDYGYGILHINEDSLSHELVWFKAT